MKSFFVSLFAVLLCCTTFNLRAQDKTAPDFKIPVSYVDNFFSIYKADGPEKALTYIATKNKETISGDQWETLKIKISSVKKALGEFKGYELITQKNAANSLVLFSYLVKHENHPIRFTFVFYKAGTEWVIYDIKFDSDDLIEELKQSSKL